MRAGAHVAPQLHISPLLCRPPPGPVVGSGSTCSETCGPHRGARRGIGGPAIVAAAVFDPLHILRGPGGQPAACARGGCVVAWATGEGARVRPASARGCPLHISPLPCRPPPGPVVGGGSTCSETCGPHRGARCGIGGPAIVAAAVFDPLYMCCSCRIVTVPRPGGREAYIDTCGIH